jgi:carbon-monoxide dehydrogenase catalytic subunit
MADKEKKKKEVSMKTCDPAALEMFGICKEKGIDTCWDRREAQQPQCKYGTAMICCQNCAMGPCRITKKASYGICGADASTIAARNFARMVAGGAASHSDHGRGVAETFLMAAKGEAPGYEIQDEQKLLQTAMHLGVKTEGRAKKDIAIEIGEIALSEYGQQMGELRFLKRAPESRREVWQSLGIAPRGIDREVVEIMHRTHIGVDMEFRNIMMQASRAALSDGWGGSMIATELQDILFRTPVPLQAQVNLGVLKDDEVNIIIHGHEPLLSEMIVLVSKEKELLELAKQKGAKGINLAGICCTANEILMRHGVSIAGNFLQQELAIATGAVEAMVVDVQCVFQSLPRIAKHFHTKVINTAPKARMEGAEQIHFHEDNAIESAKAIVRAAVENYANRGQTNIPQGVDDKSDLIAGFTHETIEYMLGGRFRASYRPLNDNIMNGRLFGVAGVVGCNNPGCDFDVCHTELVKELISNNVLVVQTGCSAIACGKQGMLTPEAAMEFAGSGLREVCQTVGIPPVLHAGSCVDNSRILIALSEMVREGGLGTDINDLPGIGVAPEWMSEKAVSIGQYFVASGANVIFGGPDLCHGSDVMYKYLTEGIEKDLKAKWFFESDPAKIAALCMDQIKGKREALGIMGKQERKLFDMEARRALEV